MQVVSDQDRERITARMTLTFRDETLGYATWGTTMSRVSSVLLTESTDSVHFPERFLDPTFSLVSTMSRGTESHGVLTQLWVYTHS